MKSVHRAVVFSVLFLPIGSAFAAPPAGWYGGLSLGQSTIDVTTRDWDDGTLTGTQLNRAGIAYKVIAGYRFTRLLSVEGAYMHFADTTFSGNELLSTSTIWKPGPVMGESRAQGVSLQGVLTKPFLRERLAVFAKGGLFFWNTTKISRPTIAGGTLAIGDELYQHDDGVHWIYGVGAEVRFYEHWHVRLEWEHTMVGLAETDDRNVDLPSLGVTLDF